MQICIVYYKRHKARHFEALSTREPGTNLELSNGQFGYSDLQLNPNVCLLDGHDCIIGKGKSATVQKGELNGKIIAIKIFLPLNLNSWTMETDIYKQIVDHENILKFLGVTEQNNIQGTEYWLGTEYHRNGSLYDFLKINLISWKDFCTIILSIAKGLAFLHEENSTIGKPSIAHRDFKSKNVLIKDDLTACISDFGLALVLDSHINSDSQVAQVGTTRDELILHLKYKFFCLE